MSAAEVTGPATVTGTEPAAGPASLPAEEAPAEAVSAAFYASVASFVEDVGVDPVEAREAYLDCMARIIADMDAVYFEGAAEAASRKRLWGYHAARLGTDYLAALLELLLRGSCNREALAQALADIAEVVGLETEAREALMKHVVGGSCGEARYAVAAVLAIPPAARGAEA